MASTQVGPLHFVACSFGGYDSLASGFSVVTGFVRKTLRTTKYNSEPTGFWSENLLGYKRQSMAYFELWTVAFKDFLSNSPGILRELG